MNKTITFKYTKDSGAESERTLFVLSGPTENYKGIDLSELEFDEVQAFIKEANEASAAFQAAMQKIQEKFDVKHNFRQFIPSKMSMVESI